MGETAAGSPGVSPVISAVELRHNYGTRRAVDGVSLSLVAGEMVALIGPNGAGKTTLLSMLAGVIAPDGGTLTAPGRVGWVPQRSALYARLTVAENLRFFARLEQLEDVDGAVEAMVAQMQLTERINEPVGRLSGGNRQRVNVGIGLLGRPAALLLDEPTSALDPTQRARLWEFIRGFVDTGTAVLFSTHDMNEAGLHPDRVLEMVDGKLTAGTPAVGDLTRGSLT